MARIRTIKPDFFTSEDIVGLTPVARLLYVALWCEADKRGRMVWKPRTFKMRWLPGDDCAIADVCAELIEAGLVVLYGDDLAYIPGFEKHQHVNPRETESSLPDPEGYVAAGPRKVGKTLREAVFERDGYKCVRCGSDDRIEVDHILPQSCGGPHIIENLRTLCKSCNAGRPVQGKGLDDDLARDGLTVEILRSRFGIDASNLDVHAQVGKERKGKEGEGRVPTRGRRGEVTLTEWVLALPEDEAVIGEDDKIFDWAAKVALPRDWIALAWFAFENRYGDSGKRYTNWRTVFRKAVQEDWLKLWRADSQGRGWILTTAGEMAQRERHA